MLWQQMMVMMGSCKIIPEPAYIEKQPTNLTCLTKARHQCWASKSGHLYFFVDIPKLELFFTSVPVQSEPLLFASVHRTKYGICSTSWPQMCLTRGRIL